MSTYPVDSVKTGSFRYSPTNAGSSGAPRADAADTAAESIRITSTLGPQAGGPSDSNSIDDSDSRARISDESEELIAWVGDDPVVTGRVERVARRRSRLVREMRLTLVVVPKLVVPHGLVAAACTKLIRRAAGAADGVWDVMTVRSATHRHLVAAAASNFAVRMDFGCDVPPSDQEGAEVRIRTPGRRGSVAHFLDAIPSLRDYRTWPRSVYFALRRRTRLALGRRGNLRGNVCMVLELPPFSPASLTPPAGLMFEEVEASEVIEHPRRFASYGTDVDQRLNRGDRCFAGRIAGEAVFRFWLSTDDAFFSTSPHEPGSGERCAYAYDSFTKPEWRGRAVQGAAFLWLARLLDGQIDRLVVSIELANFASLRAVEKVGFRRLENGVACEAAPQQAAGQLKSVVARPAR